MEIEIPLLHERKKEKPIFAFSPFPLTAKVEAERSIFEDRSRRRILAGFQEPLPFFHPPGFPRRTAAPPKNVSLFSSTKMCRDRRPSKVQEINHCVKKVPPSRGVKWAGDTARRGACWAQQETRNFRRRLPTSITSVRAAVFFGQLFLLYELQGIVEYSKKMQESQDMLYLLALCPRFSVFLAHSCIQFTCNVT